MIVPAEDRIYIDTWAKLVKELGGKLVYRPTEEAPDFFKEITGSNRDVTLVTACSDFGLAYQAESHPNQDLLKLAQSVSWQSLGKARDTYHSVVVGPACLKERCCQTDKYSLRVDRFTYATFPEFPKEVSHWFTTNLGIDVPWASPIPFGLNTDGPGSSYIDEFISREKTKLLYVNFQDNTIQRVLLKQHFAEQPWCTFRGEASIPVREYLEEVSRHRFVLCPAGNGLDCYRIWEALYLGCYPVLEDSPFARRLALLYLPIVVVNQLSSLTPESLDKIEAYLVSRGDLTMEAASASYWRSVLKDEA